MKTFIIPATLILTSTFFSAVTFSKEKKKEKDPLPTWPLEFVQNLNLEKPLETGRGAFVTSASGVVKFRDQFYVVADDELSLFSFHLQDKFLTPHQVLKGALPADNKQRKSSKPDFESLILLSPQQWPPHGALVAWPSGSTPQRMKAFTLPLDKEGKMQAAIQADILPLANQLLPLVKELNFEGLTVHEDKVLLFQRGNSVKGKNGMVEIPLESWRKGLQSSAWDQKARFLPVTMGNLQGIKLTFADATWTKYGLLALASSEDTPSSYADGTIHGTALVKIVGDRPLVLAKFEPITKLEGLWAQETPEGLELYMVEDADDPTKPGRLFKISVPASKLESTKSR